MVTVDTDVPVGTEPQWVHEHRGTVWHSGGGAQWDTVGLQGHTGTTGTQGYTGTQGHTGTPRATQGRPGGIQGTHAQAHRGTGKDAQTHRHTGTKTQRHRATETQRDTGTQRRRDTETERQETVGRWVGVGDVVPCPHEMTICDIHDRHPRAPVV